MDGLRHRHPQALNFVDREALEAQTGYPVRSDYKDPDAPDVLPDPDAMAVCPATFNTINKWAQGISDTLALGLITEAIGMGLPLVAAPALNSAQAAHPAFGQSVETLRTAGVTVLYGPDVYEPGPPRTGGRPYDWEMVVRAVAAPRHGADPYHRLRVGINYYYCMFISGNLCCFVRADEWTMLLCDI